VGADARACRGTSGLATQPHLKWKNALGKSGHGSRVEAKRTFSFLTQHNCVRKYTKMILNGLKTRKNFKTGKF
jgi:hypothetical protein